MKRPGVLSIRLILLVAVIIIAFGLYIFYKAKKPYVIKELRQFSFSSANSLNEWDEKVLARNQTDYSVVQLDGKGCVKAVSENSASALFFRQRLSCKMNPFLRWKWKAEKFPLHKKKETLKSKEEFDFVAQVYVVFSARFFLNARAIQYVWAENLPVGTVAMSPYTNKVGLLVLESGSSEGWKEEARDIRADFRKLFGTELEKDVDAVAFMTDADSTKSSAIAYYTDIVFGYLETTEDLFLEPKPQKPEEPKKAEPVLEVQEPETQKKEIQEPETQKKEVRESETQKPELPQKEETQTKERAEEQIKVTS